MTEKDVRRIVREEMDRELLKEGGIYDYVRGVVINTLKQLGLDRWFEATRREH